MQMSQKPKVIQLIKEILKTICIEHGEPKCTQIQASLKQQQQQQKPAVNTSGRKTKV